MVVLAASICTRGGKAILSRQFRDLEKDKIISLLANFPSLLSDAKQHTTVEDENVRYVYQPLEEFYVVLITNKHSNILQDIDTLHTFASTITTILRTVDEREIFDNCFEILSAFDEIINLGYKETLSLSQIVTFLEMESHEEKIQEIIERNKELEATEDRKRKAKEIQRKEMMKKNMESFEFQQQQNFVSPTYQAQTIVQPSSYHEPEPEAAASSSRLGSARKGGLQLGKKSSRFGGAAPGESSQPLLISTPATPRQSTQVHRDATPVTPSKERIANNGILITINEKFSAQITREGSVSQSEIKGDLQLRVNNPELALSKINLELTKSSDITTQYKTHPNVDKSQFNSSSIIGLKDPSKPFPSNDQALGVLRWKSTPKGTVGDDVNVLLPIVLTTWVNNNENGTVTLTFEYEVLESKKEAIKEVSLVISASNATIESSDNDNVSLTYVEDGLALKLNKLDEFSTGSFEVLVGDCHDEEILFPMELYFDVNEAVEAGSENAVVTVGSVTSNETGEELPFDLYYNASNEGYYIV